jgi:hypothetical protein
MRSTPVLGDEADGVNTALRERLHEAGRDYVLAIGARPASMGRDDILALAAHRRQRPPPEPGARPRQSRR